MASNFEFELRYDLRNPPGWERPWNEFYGRFLEQVEWADAAGFDVVDLNEHHFSEDGYLPSPVTMAAAIAARTKRIKIRLGVVILPYKHPVQLAEELSVVDNLSGGRLEVILGAGYRGEEYAGFGVAMNERGSRMEEGLEILRRCWDGETFSFEGKHWNLKDVRVTPRPFQRPRPMIVVGGSSVAAAKRAARLGDGFAPTNHALLNSWSEEMVRLGKDPSAAMQFATRAAIGGSIFVHISETPEADWDKISKYVLYVANCNAAWTEQRQLGQHPGAAQTAEELRATGAYVSITPEQAIREAQKAIADGVAAKLRLQPMMGGMPSEIGQSCLELVAKEIIPKLRPATA